MSCPLTPKSHSLISPREFTKMLEGLTSEWETCRVQENTWSKWSTDTKQLKRHSLGILIIWTIYNYWNTLRCFWSRVLWGPCPHNHFVKVHPLHITDLVLKYVYIKKKTSIELPDLQSAKVLESLCGAIFIKMIIIFSCMTPLSRFLQNHCWSVSVSYTHFIFVHSTDAAFFLDNPTTVSILEGMWEYSDSFSIIFLTYCPIDWLFVEFFK